MNTKILLAVLIIAGAASSASAASPGANPPLFAGYWHDFVDHWLGLLKQQNGIVMTALGVGVVSLFIITRGKWKKN